MRDAAISVSARKGESRAIEVLAIAQCVREAKDKKAPSQVPFLLELFKKGVGVLAQQGGGSIRVPQ